MSMANRISHPKATQSAAKYVLLETDGLKSPKPRGVLAVGWNKNRQASLSQKCPWLVKDLEQRARGSPVDDAGAVQCKWAAESRGVKINDVFITDAEQEARLIARPIGRQSIFSESKAKQGVNKYSTSSMQCKKIITRVGAYSKARLGPKLLGLKKRKKKRN